MDGIIIKDNFLELDYLENLEELVKVGKRYRLDDSQNHVMSYSEYSWNMILSDIRTSKLRYPLLEKLEKIYGETVPKENLNEVQLFAKDFEENSFCAPHSEIESLYGPWVFMLYLTNETDGELCLDGLKITPRRNRLVVMRTGIEHWVEKCSGDRLNITGWSFASPEIVERWKKAPDNPK